MKRFLCPTHIHHLKVQGKSINLDSKQCSICRFEARPLSLIDAARQFENIAESMRIAYENPDYDPFGYTWMDVFKIVNKLIKSCHKDYRKSIIDQILKDVENETIS